MTAVKPSALFYLIVDALASELDPGSVLDANDLDTAAEAVIRALSLAPIECPEAGVVLRPPELVEAFAGLKPRVADRLIRACVIALASGRINRLDIVIGCGVSVPQASADIGHINRVIPRALRYDAHAKAYRPGDPLRELCHV